jgi:hypothetical protein
VNKSKKMEQLLEDIDVALIFKIVLADVLSAIKAKKKESFGTN